MSAQVESTESDRAPGSHQSSQDRLRSYTLGLALAIILTATSFAASSSNWVWGPSIPVLLAVLAIAQMGVHLVFFLHISTAPDSTNNILSLAFGVFVVGLVIFGSMIIIANLNHNMMPMDQIMDIHRQR
ncbi:MAG TPA: cytochrome o ubiquinol oxidase subunit IV [Steroidobacteraceae bacterium]|nr:cytochrome o ubiquinol oxidase subunit IV [Steroidobacteraceae bacterium]